MINRNKYNELLNNVVGKFFNEMMELAKKHNITEVDFTETGIEMLSGRFEDETTDEIRFEDIARIEFDFKENIIYVVSESGIKGYFDQFWGDYIDVGNIFPKVYQMFAEYLNNLEEKLA